MVQTIQAPSLLVEQCSGALDIESLKASMTRLAAAPEFNPEKPILIDLEDARLNFEIDAVDEIADLHDQVFKLTTTKRAILSQNPHDVALAMMFGLKIHAPCKPFSERESAEDWLLI